MVIVAPHNYAEYSEAQTERGGKQMRFWDTSLLSALKPPWYLNWMYLVQGIQADYGANKKIRNIAKEAVTREVMFKAISISLDTQRYNVVLENPDLLTDLWSMYSS